MCLCCRCLPAQKLWAVVQGSIWTGAVSYVLHSKVLYVERCPRIMIFSCFCFILQCLWYAASLVWSCMLWETSWQYEHIIVCFHFSSLLFLLLRQSSWSNSSCSHGMCILKMLYFSAVYYKQYVVMLLPQFLGLFQGAFTVLVTGYSNRSIHLFDSRYENPWESKQFLWNFVSISQFWLKMDKKNRWFHCAPVHILALNLRVINWMLIAAKMFQTKDVEKNETRFIPSAFFSIIRNRYLGAILVNRVY